MEKIKIAVIGLGYVGLPLARLFATQYPVIGYDINEKRIAELKDGKDSRQEVDNQLLQSVMSLQNPSITDNPGLYFTTDPEDIRNCNFYIITAPTPVDEHNNPDMTPLQKASETVGKLLSVGDIIVYESTVYPGATEEVCIPILEKKSGLQFNKDFFAGYSPERINPGDKEHTVEKVRKVTSGSTPEIAQQVDRIYRSVIEAGTHLAPSIKVAEASKVIENAQRDINIAFVNELKKIFDKIGINTHDVLEAAGTKWNFLPFKPGLVGGHCIGVDPYYLAQKAQEYGYHPEIILAGRRINDSMGEYVATQVIKAMIQNGLQVKNSDILILGITFKENCTDIRNTKVIDVIKSLNEYGARLQICDPWADPEEVYHEYQLKIVDELPSGKFDAVVVAVPHKDFEKFIPESLLKENGILYNLKNG